MLRPIIHRCYGTGRQLEREGWIGGEGLADRGFERKIFSESTGEDEDWIVGVDVGKTAAVVSQPLTSFFQVSDPLSAT